MLQQQPSQPLQLAIRSTYVSSTPATPTAQWAAWQTQGAASYAMQPWYTTGHLLPYPQPHLPMQPPTIQPPAQPNGQTMTASAAPVTPYVDNTAVQSIDAPEHQSESNERDRSVHGDDDDDHDDDDDDDHHDYYNYFEEELRKLRRRVADLRRRYMEDDDRLNVCRRSVFERLGGRLKGLTSDQRRRGARLARSGETMFHDAASAGNAPQARKTQGRRRGKRGGVKYRTKADDRARQIAARSDSTLQEIIAAAAAGGGAVSPSV